MRWSSIRASRLRGPGTGPAAPGSPQPSNVAGLSLPDSKISQGLKAALEKGTGTAVRFRGGFFRRGLFGCFRLGLNKVGFFRGRGVGEAGIDDQRARAQRVVGR